MNNNSSLTIAGRPASTRPVARVAIVISHPIPNAVAWYREIAAQPDINLRVYFCCDWGSREYYDPQFARVVTWDVPLFERYAHEFLPIARRPARLRYRDIDNPGVVAALERFEPDVVLVHGYAFRTMWRVARWCRRSGRLLMLISDSNGRHKPPLWKRAVKQAVVRHFYAKVDGAFCVGSNNRAYHRAYGLPDTRLFAGTIAIDITRLRAAVEVPEVVRQQMRVQLSIPANAFTLMFCGKYAPHKRPLDLLKAIVELRERGIQIWALLVGEGSERPTLEAFLRDQQLDTAILTGFVNQTAIARYYVASDAVVLPSSQEQFGLVLSEALAFGLPLIASDSVGGVGEVGPAQPGVNALIYPVGDVSALSNAISRLHTDQEIYDRMRRASFQLSRDHGVEAAAKAFANAVHELVSMGPRDGRRLRW